MAADDRVSCRTPSLALSRRTVLGIGLSWGFVAACGQSAPQGRFGRGFTKVPATSDILAMEHAMFERLNRDRAAGGLTALAYDEDLAAIGRAHSRDMREHHFFAHESLTTGTLEDRLDVAGYLALAGRENLAEASDVTTAQDGLMKSPGHHANIMSKDVTRIGIGIVRGGVKDPANFLFTQVFANPAEGASASATRDIVVQRIDVARKERRLASVKHDGRFRDLADSYVGDLADKVDDAATSRVSSLVMDALSKHPPDDLPPGHSLGVMVDAAMVLDPSMYEVPEAVLSPGVIEFGVAAHEGRDARGRPAIKVLLLIAR